MSWSYSCPTCRATLNPREDLVLVAARGETKVLLQFHPRPGDYELHKPDGLELEPGEAWSFFCPVCRANLATEEGGEFCRLLLRAEGRSRELLFSRVAGKRATFILSQGEVLEKHGTEAEEAMVFLDRHKWMI
jgi:hypothetical protein